MCISVLDRHVCFMSSKREFVVLKHKTEKRQIMTIEKRRMSCFNSSGYVFHK